MKKLKKIAFIPLIFLEVFALSSCKDKAKEPSATPSVASPDAMQLVVRSSEAESSPITRKDLWHKEEGYVAILFGYGFSDEGFYGKMLSKLSAEYGLEEEEGVVFPINYAETLKSHINNLPNVLQNKNIKGLILLGAPENTYRTLNQIREDDWDQKFPYPIFSFFPQGDNMEGEEAICTFVVEHDRTAEDDASEEGTSQKINEETEDLIMHAVRYILVSDFLIEPDLNIHQHGQAIAGAKKVRRYTDQETSMQSINHFVIEE